MIKTSPSSQNKRLSSISNYGDNGMYKQERKITHNNTTLLLTSSQSGEDENPKNQSESLSLEVKKPSRNRKKLFPRMLKSDVRWILGQMWVNTLNYQSYEMILSFLTQYGLPNLVHTHILPEVDHRYNDLSGGAIIATGIKEVARKLIEKFSVTPDVVIRIDEVNILRSTHIQGSRIEVNGFWEGSLLYEVCSNESMTQVGESSFEEILVIADDMDNMSIVNDIDNQSILNRSNSSIICRRKLTAQPHKLRVYFSGYIFITEDGYISKFELHERQHLMSPLSSEEQNHTSDRALTIFDDNYDMDI